jgi:hypothetical protein
MKVPKNSPIAARHWRRKLCAVIDPVVQRIHRENAERMYLASFVARLVENPGRQVRFSNPHDKKQEALIEGCVF